MTRRRRDADGALSCPFCTGRGLLDGAICDGCGGNGRVTRAEFEVILTEEVREEEGDDAGG